MSGHLDVSDASALLIHSPLVGPATMRPLGAALAEQGWSVHVPDLRDAVVSAPSFATRAAQQPRCDVVVGHSGAGAFLPAVAAAVGASTVVFVDAIVPGDGPIHQPPASLLALLDSLPVVDGVLPAWHEWWPPGVVRQLVPDDARRAELIAEMPRVARSFYDEPVPLPARWWHAPAGYLQLSRGYDDDRARADAWGWPTRCVDGGHLDLVTRPHLVAVEVRDLAAAAHRSR